MWQQCHEDEDWVLCVCARVRAEEFARDTVMETLLLSAWETNALLFLNFGATTVPQKGKREHLHFGHKWNGHNKIFYI